MRNTMLAVLLLGACRGPSSIDTTPPDTGGVVVNLVGHDISPPLRDLAKAARSARTADDIEMEPARPIPHPRMRRAIQPDRVVQSKMGTAPIVATTANFEGMGAGIPNFTPGGVPPDTDGDIGPNHYVQVVNISLAVFSRTGELMMGPVDTGTLWTGFVGACAQTNDGDAVVRYDHIADRWVVAQFSIEDPFFQCVAVSTGPDPTGTYARYQFSVESLNDYPKVGLWPDGYYFSFNMFGNGGFAGGKICAMDRVKMLAGAPDATMQCFDAGPNFGALLNADVDGKNLPPPGAPNYIVAVDTETDLAYWTLKVDFATPANSTFTGPTPIPIEPFTMLCDGGNCVQQPTGGSILASLGDRAMNRFVYRRFADHESLLMSHSVTAGAGGGIRWYELRTPTTPTVFQQGTFAPDGAFRWIPSIAMDGSGDIAAIYTVSSTTINPSIRYTARTPSDAPGTMSMEEGTIAAGAAVQTNISRWGDYSALNIDPVDDCTFWGTNEYKVEAGRSNWHTRIASFQLPTCGSFSLTAPDTETVAQGGMATYVISTATLAGTPQMLQLTATNLPTGVTATFDPPAITAGGTSTITLTADIAATLGPAHYTIAGAGLASSGMVDVMLTVEPPPPMPDGAPGGEGGGCCGASSGGSPLAPLLLGVGVILVVGRRRRR